MFLFLFTFSFSLLRKDLKSVLIGHWTANLTSPDLAAVANLRKNYYLEINETEQQNLLNVSVYSSDERKESKELVLFCEILFDDFVNQNMIHFIQNDEKIDAKIEVSQRFQLTASGKSKDYIYHFLIESKTKMHLSLFDQNNSWYVLDFLKEVDRSPAPFWKENFQLIVLGLTFIVAYTLGYVSQRNAALKEKRGVKSQDSRKNEKHSSETQEKKQKEEKTTKEKTD